MGKARGAPYTQEEKQKAVRLVDAGQTVAATARTLGLVAQTVSDWVKADRQGKQTSHVPQLTREAELRRDHLLFLWLTTLPWRQRNLRECRVDGKRYSRECQVGKKRAHANIFWDVPDDNIATPSWVDELIAKDRGAKVWQFYFTSSETKNGRIAKGVLPEQLVGPLEEYLGRWRQILLGTCECSNLFVDEAGAPLSKSSILRLVRKVSYRELGQPITPHAFRHSFAQRWLEDHPREYSALSDILWHAGTRATVKVYGDGFDESHGAVFVDQWFKELESKGIGNVQVAATQLQSGSLPSIEEGGLRRDHLLLLWLTTLPWKQRYLRKCRVGKTGARGNIFNDVVAKNVATPPWVKKLIANDPSAKVWQYRFSSKETNSRRVRGVLPERLVGPLEDYLDHWRPLLVGSSRSCNNLFVSEKGKPISIEDMTAHVGTLSLRSFLGRWIVPSEFRRSFAEAWLAYYPLDYLILSKILWHTDPRMTERLYGKKLDASIGAVRVDQWNKESKES